MKRKKNIIYFLKMFIGVFLVIVLVGGVTLLSVWLVKGNQKMTDPQKVEKHVPIEKFPGVIETIEPIESEIKAVSGKYGTLLLDVEKMKSENIYAKETWKEEETTLLFGGDILFDPNYAMMATLLRKGGNIEEGFSKEILGEMRSADIFMLNNEFPYSDRGTKTPEKAFTFRATPDSARYLTDMGVDIVSLANNHAYDYGEEALIDSLRILKEEGVCYAGAGNTIEEAAKPLYFIANDTKIAFICATQIERLENPDTKEATETTPGVFRCWNPERLYKVIAEAKDNSDFVIVYVHWGTENEKEIDWAQRDHAPKYAEAGADLVIGDHPHCLQKIEFIGDVPVVYSLGNFWFNSKTLDTALIKVILEKSGGIRYQFIPCKQEGGKTILLEGQEKQRVIDEMNLMSPTAFVDIEGNIKKK